jgi:predicted phosphodiesterase
LAAVDSTPQQFVAERMREVAYSSRPDFVINVGDSFYPGGIDDHCDVRSRERAFDSLQFKYIFERMYGGSGLDGKEWWGVLGNHDYGGFRYNKAWDQLIFYTWHALDGRWLLPALYWSRRVDYGDFTADFFFIDTNKNDAGPPNLEQEHNICSYEHNKGDLSCGLWGLTDPSECHKWFADLFEEQKPWLEKELAASDATWQIIVTHYPPNFQPSMNELLKPMSDKYDVDLILTGHTHRQEVHYKEPPFFDTAWVVSGGGGGIGSESVPNMYGADDQYGFMDLTISRDHIVIEAHSHGGVQGETIIRSTTVVYPKGNHRR